MSAFGDAFAAVRSVMLMQANMERIEKGITALIVDQDGLRDAIAHLSVRMARMEGVIEGFGMASASQPRLPRE